MTTKTKGAPAGPAAAKTAKTKTARPAEPPPPGAEVQAAHAPKAARRRLSPAGGPARGRAEAAEAMARSMFFEGLPRPMLEQLAATTVWKFWPAGRLVFCRGDEASGFHLTVSGLVKIFVSAPNGRERVLHLCEPGTVFGEAAVFRPGGYPASAEAAVDSETLLFPQKEFRALTAANPDLAF
ncbi:MAG: cyclic nucleotide-binding domain-containing protein, partial [Deltaproteobacteria bacterium]|nr:cyclic nucleotide-binding domain-containing protein [Deltaproteobacteria bacterium]